MKCDMDVATELRKELRESQNQRDKRIEDLWKTLNPGKSELDLRALQRGLRKIDHPLANADAMLRKIMATADTNQDGKISYEEFRTFMDHTEGHLLGLFRSADTNGDGKLDKRELLAAYRRAGVAMPMRRLDSFFKHVDVNNDGFITFDEWRDFLLFMPAFDSEETLHTILSFYSLTSEGDSLVSDETLEGLGTSRSLLYILFGSVVRLLAPPGPDMTGTVEPVSPPPPTPSDTQGAPQSPAAAAQSILQPTSEDPHPRSIAGTLQNSAAPADARSSAMSALSYGSPTVSPGAVVDPLKLSTPAGDGDGTRDEASAALASEEIAEDEAALDPTPEKSLWKLTDFVPDPGYFLAGAIAGGVSRTATAPLDRLKVYLLVNTSTTQTSRQVVGAVKGGQAAAALKHITNPFATAVRDLWAAGGARTFFAGNGLNVIKIMPETAIKFGSYEAAKRALAQLEGHAEPKQISAYSKFAAGGVAGMVSQFCVYPLDTLKFRLQCETTKDGPKGNALVLQTARRMFADGGFRAAYRGVTMGLVGMFPYSAIDMGTFEFLKTSYRKWRGRQTNTHPDDVVTGNIVTGVMGASSGAFGASIVYPLNVLRTRLQTQGTVMHRETYTGIVDVARKTVRKEGYRALYKGLTPNLLKVAPALSITWMVYEKSKRVLGLD